MITDIIDSLFRPRSYGRLSSESAARSASYIAFLSLIFVGSIGIAVKLRLAPLFDETFVWLETQMPVLRFSNGAVASTPPGPMRLEHPRAKEIAVMIDTTRKDPVSAAQMSDAKVMAYLTGGAMYLQRGQGQIETLDLSKSAPDKPITVDANSFREMEKAFNWVFYPALLLFFFLSFALSMAVSGLIYALVGKIRLSMTGGALGFGGLFRVGLHAQTAGCLIYALDAILPVTIPHFQLLSIALSLAYVWLGAAAASARPSEPAPAA